MNTLLSSPQTQNLALLAGRVLMSIIFLVAGYGKITGYAGTTTYMANYGIPGGLLPLVILLELGGAVALIVGFQTRLVALLLAGFCILSAVVFHTNFAQAGQSLHLMKNLAIAGGFLALMAAGPGAFSMDQRNKG